MACPITGSTRCLYRIEMVEELIERRRPAAICTHQCGDLNVDHKMVSRAVLTATRPTENHPVHKLYMFKIASFHGVGVPTTFSGLQAKCICRL